MSTKRLECHGNFMRALVTEMEGLGHPAYEITSNRWGGPVRTEEQEIFNKVNNMSLSECWGIVKYYIKKTKEVLSKQ